VSLCSEHILKTAWSVSLLDGNDRDTHSSGSNERFGGTSKPVTGFAAFKLPDLNVGWNKHFVADKVIGYSCELRVVLVGLRRQG